MISPGYFLTFSIHMTGIQSQITVKTAVFRIENYTEIDLKDHKINLFLRKLFSASIHCSLLVSGICGPLLLHHPDGLLSDVVAVVDVVHNKICMCF